MNRFCNIIISALFSLLLIGPAFVFICEKTDVNLPSWMTAEDAKYLSGGMKDVDAKATLSLDGFYSKELQNTLSAEVDNRIPLKSFAMLSNAALQRFCISLANTSFGWDCYPTRFQSDVVLVPKEQALVGLARKPYTLNNGAVSWFLDMVIASSKKNPNVRFVFDIVVDTYSCESNPTHKYVSGSYTDDWVKQNIIAPLESNGIATVVDNIVERELYAEWHTTEHHWRIERALRSYNRIASLLDIERFEVGKADLVLVKGEWAGSNARSGLDFECCDWLEDIPIKFDFLNAFENGRRIDRGLRSAFIAKPKEVEVPFYDSYHAYYGQPRAEIIYRNSKAGVEGTCLFVEQSYGVPLEPYIASNFKTTVCISPMNASVGETLDEYISEYDVDTVIIQLGFTNMYLMKDRSPAFYFGAHDHSG